MSSLETSMPQFFTATNLEWKPLLLNDDYKEIIISSMKFLTEQKRVNIFAFTIMSNHLHLLWQMLNGHRKSDVQRDFLKFTAQKIKSDLLKTNSGFLNDFYVNAKDRKFQFWERNPRSLDIWSRRFLHQKLNYIHNNPVKAGLCQKPEDYYYSSARFYKTGIDDWGFLTNYDGHIFSYG